MTSAWCVSKGGMKFEGPAVLWLDDIERFLNGDVSVDEMLSWSSGKQGRIVAATRGSSEPRLRRGGKQ
jgi:hypothetical protein